MDNVSHSTKNTTNRNVHPCNLYLQKKLQRDKNLLRSFLDGSLSHILRAKSVPLIVFGWDSPITFFMKCLAHHTCWVKTFVVTVDTDILDS